MRGRGWVAITGELVRLHSDYMHLEYGDLDSDYVFVNLWRFDLRGVGPIVALELGYGLQCRKDARGAAIVPLNFGQVVRWLRERPVDSLLIGSDAAWARAAAKRVASCLSP